MVARLPSRIEGVIGGIGIVHGGEVLISEDVLRLVAKLQQAIDDAPALDHDEIHAAA